MKVAFFSCEPWERQYLEQSPALRQVGVEMFFFDHALDHGHLSSADAAVVSIFIDSTVDETVFTALPNLKLVVTRSTGYDHIDVAAAKARGVVVASVPSYGENTVAEYTFALLLALSRKIFQSARQVKETGSFKLDGLRGFDLKGKTIGVVGTGRIGRHVIRMAQGFEMLVVATDARPDSAFAATAGFRYLPLPELLAASDVVTLHTPYLKETHHLINAETLGQMKLGAYLINTSRGAVVDTTALAAALGSGRLGGAALDVLEEEGAIKDELALLASGHPEEQKLRVLLADHALMKMPNVIITPHNAFNTTEALTRILDTTVEDIVQFVAGHPVNVVS